MAYPRETVEYQTVTVTINGTPATNGVAFSVVTAGQRPGEWTPALIIDGGTAFLIDGMTPGVYTVWAQVNDPGSAETPVIDCGNFRVD